MSRRVQLAGKDPSQKAAELIELHGKQTALLRAEDARRAAATAFQSKTVIFYTDVIIYINRHK